MERRFIKEKEARKLLLEFFEKIGIDPQDKRKLNLPIELANIDEYEIFFINKKPIFAKSQNKLYPTLASDGILLDLPRVIVNMGAIPYLCNGADVMAPGIVSFEGTFRKGDIVVVHDEQHQKPLAITSALYNVEEAKRLQHGKVLQNIHYVGDKLWNTLKQLKR